MKVSIPDIFIHFFCSKKRHLKMFKSIEKYLKILTTYKIFSIEGTRPDTQHKLFAVIVSACQKKRPTDGRTDRRIHSLLEPQLIGKKAKQMGGFTGFRFKPLNQCALETFS